VPYVPSTTICSMLGCKNTKGKISSLCIEHGGIDRRVFKGTYSDERLKDSALYQTSFWKRKRTLQLSIQPLCQSCLLQGIVAQAVAVDHVFPWRVIQGDAFYINLFQSLCTPCHSTKTAYEQAGIYIHYTPVSQVRHSKMDYTISMIESR
jgi:5-methylcytosine-specific restriction protein A